MNISCVYDVSSCQRFNVSTVLRNATLVDPTLNAGYTVTSQESDWESVSGILIILNV